MPSCIKSASLRRLVQLLKVSGRDLELDTRLMQNRVISGITLGDRAEARLGLTYSFA